MDFDYKRDFERMMQYCRETGDIGWLSSIVPHFGISPQTSAVSAINAEIFVETVKEWATIHPYEPEIDWTKVPVDTMVEVSSDKVDWEKRFFALYIPKGNRGSFWVFRGGRSRGNAETVWPYQYCRLAEDNPAYHKDV